MPELLHRTIRCRDTQAMATIARQLLEPRRTSVASPAAVVSSSSTPAPSPPLPDAQAATPPFESFTRNPFSPLIVTGCYAQRAPQELSRSPPA